MPEIRYTSHAKGLLGEEAAENHLVQKGMTCIGRRYRAPCGEIDLILLDKEELVFAEVKTRTSRTLLSAQSAVTPSKQRKIIQTALYYLNEHPEHQNRLIRFDVIAISGEFIQHLPDAFRGYGW